MSKIVKVIDERETQRKKQKQKRKQNKQRQKRTSMMEAIVKEWELNDFVVRLS